MAKVTKSALFVSIFLWEKIGSVTFSYLYICLNLTGDLHINVKKMGGHGSCFFRKAQNRPKNHHFCTIAGYRFTKAQQCNSVSAITPCDRCVPGRKMPSPARALALCTQCIVWSAIKTAYTLEADAQTTLINKCLLVSNYSHIKPLQLSCQRINSYFLALLYLTSHHIWWLPLPLAAAVITYSVRTLCIVLLSPLLLLHNV